MIAHGVVPILNVTDLAASYAWFERLGWRKLWDYGDPPRFGAVGAGACEIFLCQGGQGGRGYGGAGLSTGPDGNQTADTGVWMTVWVDDVDEVSRRCVAQGLEVSLAPADMPWGVRETHVRHPDGHVFRFSRAVQPEPRA
jgi:catechol 2,3-dioxygenase-like lactoylglutathione lyase family enzyme